MSDPAPGASQQPLEQDTSPAPPASEAMGTVDRDPELEKLKLDRFTAKLDFWKYVIVSGFVALAIAMISPLFQFGQRYT